MSLTLKTPRQQYFNIRPGHVGRPKRSAVGNQFFITRNFGVRPVWFKLTKYHKKPFGIDLHLQAPRLLLDRNMFRQMRWSKTRNMPDDNRWERAVASMRVTEDRWSLAEEEGQLHRVNWRLYSERLRSELVAARENLPQYTLVMCGAPVKPKAFDLMTTIVKGMSVREAMAQGKLSNRKPLQILYKALEQAQQGAEAKGLDKDKLRIQFLTSWSGPSDKQIDIRSKGFYGWKTKMSTNFMVTVTEDPEMMLPERTQLPYNSVLAMKKAGLYDEPVVLDVPAITADGI